MSRIIEYTADDEMPVCIHCDNFGSEYACEKHCGPEYGWYSYRRTEKVEEEYNDGTSI